MNLTMALIKADIIAAEQAIEYYNEHNKKILRISLLTICNRLLRN